MKEKLFLRLIGIGILLWIMSRVDLFRCWDVIKGLDVIYFTVAMLISLPVLLIKAYRWKFILRLQDIDYAFKEAFLSYLGSIYVGLITPGRIGEYAKTFYLKQDKEVSTGRAFSSVLIDRLLDLFFLLLIVVAGLVIYYPPPLLKVIICLIMVIALVLAVVLKDKLGKIPCLLFSVITSKKWKSLNLQIEDFLQGISEMQRWEFSFAIFLTVISYGLFFMRCYLLALALSISIKFFTLVFFLSVVSLVVLIPISIAGLGTREGTLIFLFSQVSISQEAALSFSLLILLAVNLWAGTVGFVSWSIKPLPVAVLKKNFINSKKVGV